MPMVRFRFELMVPPPAPHGCDLRLRLQVVERNRNTPHVEGGYFAMPVRSLSRPCGAETSEARSLGWGGGCQLQAPALAETSPHPPRSGAQVRCRARRPPPQAGEVKRSAL